MILDGWRARWLRLRNRVLADPRFQRGAARFPLTRPVARRRARALFDLVAGFTYSQTLFACVETGLIAALAGEPMTARDVAARIDLPLVGAARLLKAAAAIGLVESVGERWMLGPHGAALHGNPGIVAMVAHHATLYADLADPVALLRRGGGGGALSAYWAYAESPGSGEDREVAAYSTLMAASLPMVAEQALAAYDFARHHRVLDIGGGEGAFLASIGSQTSRPALALFDIPAVEKRARAFLGGAGLADRTTFHPGDFTRDDIPTGYDLVTLVRILHDHDDDRALALLHGIRAALPLGGRLLIVEPMAGTPGAEPAGDAYFGLYLLAMGSGRPRTPREIAAMLRAAGFAASRTLSTPVPLIARAIIAHT
jgi:demethylspheroidene O-methyltransferase